MGSKAKDAAARLHEKHQTILADLLRDEENKFCADCKAKGPRWASWNLGVFVCIRCAGIHRNLGVHISRVKSVNLDSWTPEQIEAIQKGGNGQAREKYEANLPANFRRPQDDYAVEQFIRAKYERKQYLGRDGVSASKAASTEQEGKPKVKRSVEKKAPPAVNTSAASTSQRNSRSQVMAVPRPSGRSSSPQPTKLTTPSSPITKSSSARNLISMEKQKQQTPDLLTGLSPNTMQVRNSASSPDILSDTQRYSSSSTADPFNTQPPLFQVDPGLVAQQKGQPSSSSASQQQHPPLMLDPGLGGQQQQQQGGGGGGVKDSIMSLYNVQQPQYNSYTAQGYPVNAYYYHQQQQAAMRMAQQQQQQKHVSQVQQQMDQIKLRQQQPVAVGNGSVPPTAGHGGGGGGQTLNPHLW